MALFAHLNEVQKAVVDSDYRVIAWWAKAMRVLAEGLVEVRKFFADHPNPAPGDNSLRKVRKRFNKRATAVAKTTKKHFGEPWGLIAMESRPTTRPTPRSWLRRSRLLRKRKEGGEKN